ncbi:hypothetical protein CDAR_474351 [Caerostris darwini]|uniref:Uncharacterized protein n=1 Tax=Caerostris darwini TaxID=1538125 RepID=A0AAV4M487_9ARAC|nr:hypothetical protein CDAR_474351 [Caerostris darwini]
MSDFSRNKMASAALAPRTNFISRRKKTPFRLTTRCACSKENKSARCRRLSFMFTLPFALGLRIKRATGGIYGLVNIFGRTLPLLRSTNLVCSFNLPTSETVWDSVQRTIRHIFWTMAAFRQYSFSLCFIRCKV